jgi:hypothetical protein
LARGAISLGNATDEYLTREPADTIVQNQFDREIQIGQLRLKQLSLQIDAFKFLRTAFISRFPDFFKTQILATNNVRHSGTRSEMGADVRSLDTTPIAPAEDRRVSWCPSWNPDN